MKLPAASYGVSGLIAITTKQPSGNKTLFMIKELPKYLDQYEAVFPLTSRDFQERHYRVTTLNDRPSKMTPLALSIATDFFALCQK